MFQRREFLKAMGAGLLVSVLPNLSYALAPAGYQRLLVLVELKGGNDGLNTVIPYASDDYYRLRPSIGIARPQVLQLSEQVGLHPAMHSLLPLWQNQEVAVLQGVGYPEPNLSHFRSIEIWETASASNQYLGEGWLTRLFRSQPTPPGFAADGVVLSSQNLGPLDGGARAVVLSNPQDFARQAKLAADQQAGAHSSALSHILKVEGDIRTAATALQQPAMKTPPTRRTPPPRHPRQQAALPRPSTPWPTSCKTAPALPWRASPSPALTPTATSSPPRPACWANWPTAWPC
jgi:uncharacterized protein (DUF1501 family)